MQLSDLETPVLTADPDAIERNVMRMQAGCGVARGDRVVDRWAVATRGVFS